MKLTEGDLKKHIRDLAFPTSIAFFFNTMYNITDTFFSGMISTDALAALSITFPIFLMIISLNQGISIGSSALISNALGSHGRDNARVYIFQSISFGIVAALCLTIFGVYVSTHILELLGASGNYLDLARTYIQIIFYGSIFFTMNAVSNAILMAHGHAKPMRNYLVVAFFGNILLDPFFIYGWGIIPPMGFKGIGLATVLTVACGTFYMIGKVVQRGYLKGGRAMDFLPKATIFFDILRQSLPASLNMMSIAIGIFVLTFYVKIFGSESVAALGIGMRLQQVLTLPIIGLSMAVISIVGQNNGAGLYNRVEESVRITMRYGFILVGFGVALILLVPESLMSIFTNDSNVIDVGVTYLYFSAFTLPAYVIMFVKTSMLQGMKRPNFAFFLGAARQIIAPVTIFHLLIHVFHLGIESLWLAVLCIAWTAALVCSSYANYVLAIVKKKY